MHTSAQSVLRHSGGQNAQREPAQNAKVWDRTDITDTQALVIAAEPVKQWDLRRGHTVASVGRMTRDGMRDLC